MNPITPEDLAECWERIKNQPPPINWRYISSDMLKDVMSGKLDDHYLMFSNGDIVSGKELRKAELSAKKSRARRK